MCHFTACFILYSVLILLGFDSALRLYHHCDSSQVLAIPPELAKFHPQAVECHVASSIDLTIAPDMDVILRVESVDRAR
jgi:hypothetical protein